MKYFDTLPDIVYTDKALVSRLYTNIMARASFVSQVKDKPEYFYDYTIQDEDTPEIVAYKYYGDVNFWWIIAVANNINDAVISLEPGLQLRIPSDIGVILSDFRNLNS